jgi:prepilin-type processing-associated H-X9-DG protein
VDVSIYSLAGLHGLIQYSYGTTYVYSGGFIPSRCRRRLILREKANQSDATGGWSTRAIQTTRRITCLSGKAAAGDGNTAYRHPGATTNLLYYDGHTARLPWRDVYNSATNENLYDPLK